MHAIFKIHTIWSFRKELTFVASAFAVLISLPIIAVFILTYTGINIVSDALVGLDTQTNHIEIKDPRDGSMVKTIDKEISWPATGVTTLEFAQSSMYQKFHTGLDIANPKGQVGDRITPVMKGKVIYAGEISWGYGKHVIIDHGDNITTLYAHLDRVHVHAGQEVNIGDTIGTMGNTGWSTGPHLHLEIRVYGIPVNPRVFL